MSGRSGEGAILQEFDLRPEEILLDRETIPVQKIWIGGGHLTWQCWREGAPWILGLVCAFVFVLHGFIPTYQPAQFGSTYAAYGGKFIAPSVHWSWGVDRIAPDRFDVIGGLISLIGSAIIMYTTR